MLTGDSTDGVKHSKHDEDLSVGDSEALAERWSVGSEKSREGDLGQT